MPKTQYLLLAESLSRVILSGELIPGTRLPTYRAFAAQHGVALATATRAYKELERRGLIVGEMGRGVFVRDLGLPLTLGVEQSASEGQIDLVFNMPGNAGDAEILRSGLKRLANAGDLDAMLRYQPHGGRPHERKIIASHLQRSLGRIVADQLLITSGGQHGLAITAFGLLKRGDTIGTDALTYPGFKAVAALHGLNLVAIDGIGGSMNADDLERQCRARKISAIYVMPTVQNPLGSVMHEALRKRLVAVARRHDLLIIEDSAYAFLEPSPPPSLFEIAPERTVHIGGFSKNLATGLRLGYLAAPPQHMDKLSHAIRATTWNAPALISALVCGWIEDGTVAAAEQVRRNDGAQRQRLCHDILVGTRIIAHRNASYAWLPLGAGVRAEPVVTQLINRGIAVSSAVAFSISECPPQALRLAFGGVAIDQLRSALKIVRDQLAAATSAQLAA